MKCGDCGAAMMPVKSGLVCEAGCGRIFPWPRAFLPGLIPVGASVRLPGPIDGVVLSIRIGAAEHVTYEVAVYEGGVRHVSWVEDFELALADDSQPPLLIRFASAETASTETRETQ